MRRSAFRLLGIRVIRVHPCGIEAGPGIVRTGERPGTDGAPVLEQPHRFRCDLPVMGMGQVAPFPDCGSGSRLMIGVGLYSRSVVD